MGDIFFAIKLTQATKPHTIEPTKPWVCSWCGIDFEQRPHVPRRMWDSKWQCKATFACAARARAKKVRVK